MNAKETKSEISSDLKSVEKVESYPPATVSNSTMYGCHILINYSGCSSDSFNLDAWGCQSNNRGVCLLTKISATVYLSDGTQKNATPYTSSGTSYSQFAVIQQCGDDFAVTRIVT